MMKNMRSRYRIANQRYLAVVLPSILHSAGEKLALVNFQLLVYLTKWPPHARHRVEQNYSMQIEKQMNESNLDRDFQHRRISCHGCHHCCGGCPNI